MRRRVLVILAAILLCFVACGLIYVTKKYVTKVFRIENKLDKLGDVISYVHLENAASKAYYKELSETIEELLDANNANQEKKKICNISIENSSDKLDVANSYICIAKIDEQENDVLSSIKNFSYSNDLLENPNNKADIARLVIGDSQSAAEILKRMNLNIGGNSWALESDEVTKKVLEEFVKSDDRNLAGRAAYALSLRYLFGRASASLERNPGLEKAVEMQKLAIANLGIKQTKTTNVAFVFNEKYVPHAATTIVSILLNSDLDNRYNFNVIYDANDPVSPSSQAKLAALSKIRDFDIKFIPYPEELIIKNKELMATEVKKFPRLVFFKLTLENILKNLDQVTVLDVDILVLRDLQKLANTNLENNFLAAVEEPRSIAFSIIREKECKNLSRIYYNTGVMVQNLKLMRDAEINDIFIKNFDRSKCEYNLPEQDLMNQAISNKIYYLPNKWNMIPWTNDFENVYPNGYSPFIVHYAFKKPWQGYYYEWYKSKDKKAVQALVLDEKDATEMEIDAQNGKINEYILLYYPYMEYAQKLLNN